MRVLPELRGFTMRTSRPIHLSAALTLACAHVASASPPADLDLRSRCADVELSQALGEKVSATDAAACAAAPKPSKAVAKEAAPPPRPTPAIQAAAPLTPAKPASKPVWVDGWPKEDGKLFGVGSGRDLETAFAAATRVVAAQLHAQVSGTTNASDSVRAKSSDNGPEDVQRTSTASATTMLIVDAAVEDIHVDDQWREQGGTLWVLASLDMAALEKRDEAMVGAVLESLAQVEARIAAALAEKGPIPYSTLVDAVESAQETSGFMRTSVGRRLKDRWKGALERVGRTLGKVARCMEVKAVSSTSSEVTMSASCRGHAWSNARLLVGIDNGLGKVPAVVETDGSGEMTIDYGPVFGTKGATALSFTMDLGPRQQASWLVWPSQLPSNTWKVPAPLVPEAIIAIAEDAPESFKRDVAAGLRTAYGLAPTHNEGGLRANCRLTTSPPIQTGTMWVATMEMSIQLVSGGLALDTRKVKGSGAGPSSAEAQKRADEDLRKKVRALR